MLLWTKFSSSSCCLQHSLQSDSPASFETSFKPMRVPGCDLLQLASTFLPAWLILSGFPPPVLLLAHTSLLYNLFGLVLYLPLPPSPALCILPSIYTLSKAIGLFFLCSKHSSFFFLIQPFDCPLLQSLTIIDFSNSVPDLLFSKELVCKIA